MKKTAAILLTACLLAGGYRADAQNRRQGIDERIDTLEAARVTTNVEKEIRATQTSLTRLDSKDLNRGFAVLSSPDVIKTLQMLPGVSSGTELLSGFYVRGGDGYDNLFLLDGVPMYQVTHLVGLFSSFNTDVVDNLDFYKGGFPARYGGRMSSVVDVTTREGDFEEYHGSFSIGLIDGRLQFEGPIVKGKTSFNLAMRRTWLDAVTVPAVAIINHEFAKDTSNTERINGRYDFADYNARITHRFSPTSKLTASFYTGDDTFRLLQRYTDSKERYEIPLRWGNTLGSLRWDKQLREGMNLDLTGYFTRYHSDISAIIEDEYNQGDGAVNFDSAHESIVSHVNDFGINANLRWTPFENHIIRGGLAAATHRYNPFFSSSVIQKTGDTVTLQYGDTTGVKLSGWEASLFVEDEISFTRRLKANIGFRDAVYGSAGKVWNSFEPRAAFSWFVNDGTTLKLSYSRMSQYNHQVSTVHLDLPTSTWMPSTAKVRPMTSDQIAGGVYMKLPWNLHASAEAYWKTLNHIYEYNGTASLLPPIHKWDSDFLEGKGRSYGLELQCEYEAGDLYASLGYTLSWAERKFDDFWEGWYPDRNDNRHKLTLSASYRFGNGFELYGCWLFHSNSRMTVAPSKLVLNGTEYDADLFDGPNNLKLPNYHRLDLGLNWNKKTRRGNERTWNLSLYNVYCHMNAMLGEIGQSYYGPDMQSELYGTAYGIVPIIPSFSYTLKF